MFSLLLLSVYVTSVTCFVFISHPIHYCLLLLLSSACVSGYSYMFLGFGWYLVLFCVVYVGGVYILFIFVSIHSPNPVPGWGLSNKGSLFLIPLSIFLFFFFFFSFDGSDVHCCVTESSHYLCSGAEGFVYCFFCLFLMIGFVMISMVCSEKDSFFR
nr:NADH dehydrogenase subunit 6 [Haematoloechus sp. CW13H]